MAGLGEQDGVGIGGTPPIAPHKRVRHVHMLNRLKMLDAHQLTQHTGINHLLDFAIVGRVAQHMADRHDAIVALSQVQNILTLLPRLGDRLFKQHIVAQCKRLHGRTVMQMIGRCDDDSIGKARLFKDILPSLEAIAYLDIVFLRIAFLTDSNGLCHSHNINFIGVLQCIIAIDIAPAARTQHDGCNFAGCSGQGGVIKFIGYGLK